MSTYRRVLLLGLACSLLVLLVLLVLLAGTARMGRGYVTVTVVDARDVQATLACDLEDALDIAGAAKSWMTPPEAWAAVKFRADLLGWTYDSAGWFHGREARVLLDLMVRDGVVSMDVSHVAMRRGQLLASLRDLGGSLSVCGGPLVRPFPAPVDLNLAHCPNQLDRMYVLAMHRVLSAWFDV